MKQILKFAAIRANNSSKVHANSNLKGKKMERDTPCLQRYLQTIILHGARFELLSVCFASDCGIW